MNNIDYTKLGAIGAEAAHDEQAKIGRNIFHVSISDKSDAWAREESSRTAYAEAVVRAYLEQVGEGLPTVGDCLQALPTSPTTGQAIEAIRSLMLAAFAKKMEAAAKLPEKWRSVVTGAGFQSVYATCAINLEDTLSLPAVEVEPAEKWAQEKAAYAQGRKIECRNRASNGDPWTSWYAITAKEMIFFTHSLFEYRIAPDQPAQPGKLTDEELGRIALKALKGIDQTKPCEYRLAKMLAAVREAVEKQQGEEIARLTAELACLQKTYEAERNCSAERMAKIHAHEEEIRRLTARTVGQLSEITILHQLLDVEETKLATVTTERDRLLPRPMSTAPTEADANNDGRVLLLGDGNSATFASIANWGGVHSSWRRWLPLNLAAYGVQTAQEVERERFETWAVKEGYTIQKSSPGFYRDTATIHGWKLWQAACAVKEGE